MIPAPDIDLQAHSLDRFYAYITKRIFSTRWKQIGEAISQRVECKNAPSKVAAAFPWRISRVRHLAARQYRRSANLILMDFNHSSEGQKNGFVFHVATPNNAGTL